MAGIPRDKPLTDEDKNKIANGASVVSNVAGKTADYATGIAGACALSSNPIGEVCAVGMATTAVGAAAVDYTARGVEQLVQPNLGKTVTDGLKDATVKIVEDKIPVVGPILVPAASAGIDVLKDSKYGKNTEKFINDPNAIFGGSQ